jgi:nucleoside-diphosphate-sugar epimerase
MLAVIAERRGIAVQSPRFGPSRTGDIVHSTANVSLAQKAINFSSTVALQEALDETFDWFAN